MKTVFLYDFFSRHRKIRGGSLVLLSAVLLAMLLTIRFSEDISDFLPMGTQEREEMTIYQGVSGAERIYVLFSNPGDSDLVVEAIDAFTDSLDRLDARQILGTGGVDAETLADVAEEVYSNIPYFLEEADIARMDSLLARPDYLGEALRGDRAVLMFPSSPLVKTGIRRDPLGLFAPVMDRLRASGGPSGFEMYEDHLFTSDKSRAVIMVDSPFGGSETDRNTQLIRLLEKASRQMHSAFPEVSAEIIGAPAIAVGNASRIKKDSVLAVSLSLVLIVLLLLYSFQSLRNILLIFISVGWGLLFALAGLTLFRDSVSIIVIGISSVILGIAVNYPLHLITHMAHQPDRRTALQEIISPLVVGNITTVGAFMALVPLNSTALRDLGLFASLLLVGTILFVLVYLPHYVSDRRDLRRDSPFLDRLAAFSPENKRWIVIAAAMVTLPLAVLSFRTEFDADLSHINYMTEGQRRDMQYFEDLIAGDETHSARTLYVYGKGPDLDGAVADMSIRERQIDSLVRAGDVVRQNAAFSFIVPLSEQEHRIALWQDFVRRHREELTSYFEKTALEEGFAAGAFGGFQELIAASDTLTPLSCASFGGLIRTVFSRNFTAPSPDGPVYAVSALNVPADRVETVSSAMGDKCFEPSGMNRAMAGSLSDNFNYIGWACSLIVFLFLCFSFGRVELALISFIPMAVSWVWILGLMAAFGIKFNIVNIILATFIFGQGDDYTIFMTEGCQYEYARRKPILASYKRSILQSAAIMFVGIGTLILARHPAMRSLAEVTIIGMFSVVLMAYLIPPLLFKWLTVRDGRERTSPLTLRLLLTGVPKTPEDLVRARYAYKGKEIERCVRRSLREKASGVAGMNVPPDGEIELSGDLYGELALLAALTHPGVKVISHIADEDARTVARVAVSEMDTIKITS